MANYSNSVNVSGPGFGGQGCPPNHVPGPYQPAYPPSLPPVYPPNLLPNPPLAFPLGNPNPLMGPNHGPEDNPGNAPPYNFGSCYGASRGGGAMREGPGQHRGGMPRDGHGPYTMARGGAGRGARGFYSGGFKEGNGPREIVDPDFNGREEWGPSGPGLPLQPPAPQHQNCTIVIRNLPPRITEQDLYHNFGSAGMIRTNMRTGYPEIWLDHRNGEARITYQDPHVAETSIQWYNNSDFQGSVVQVEMSHMDPPPPPQDRMGGGRGVPRGPPPNRGGRFPPPRGGFGGARGPPPLLHSGGRGDGGKAGFMRRDGDWICANPDCQNTNFARRHECNRCKTPRQDFQEFPSDMNGSDGGSNRGARLRDMPPRGGSRGFSHGAGRGYGSGDMGNSSQGMMGRDGYMSRGGGSGPGSIRSMGPMRGGRGGMGDRGGFRGRGGFNPRRGTPMRGRPY